MKILLLVLPIIGLLACTSPMPPQLGDPEYREEQRLCLVLNIADAGLISDPNWQVTAEQKARIPKVSEQCSELVGYDWTYDADLLTDRFRILTDISVNVEMLAIAPSLLKMAEVLDNN